MDLRFASQVADECDQQAAKAAGPLSKSDRASMATTLTRAGAVLHVLSTPAAPPPEPDDYDETSDTDADYWRDNAQTWMERARSLEPDSLRLNQLRTDLWRILGKTPGTDAGLVEGVAQLRDGDGRMELRHLRKNLCRVLGLAFPQDTSVDWEPETDLAEAVAKLKRERDSLHEQY
jgi:hypothetical protein